MLSYFFLKKKKKKKSKMYNYSINITEEEFKNLDWKKIKEKNNYFTTGIDQNKLLSDKNKKVSTTLN